MPCDILSLNLANVSAREKRVDSDLANAQHHRAGRRSGQGALHQIDSQRNGGGGAARGRKRGVGARCSTGGPLHHERPQKGSWIRKGARHADGFRHSGNQCPRAGGGNVLCPRDVTTNGLMLMEGEGERGGSEAGLEQRENTRKRRVPKLKVPTRVVCENVSPEMVNIWHRYTLALVYCADREMVPCTVFPLLDTKVIAC